MKCPACSFDSPAGFKFCGGCGVPFGLTCESCAFGNPPGVKFCGKCGDRLDAADPSPASEAAAVAPAESESVRRQVTVMFCDLADSTFLSENLDPEELHEILGEYQRMAAGHIEAHHGHVAQYLGDGILAYFGWPHVHEDAARHAVAAGLRIVQDMKAIAASYPDLSVELAVRVGLHTGLVVVGEVGGGSRTETLALGNTPNVAARLQGLADRNTVVMSDTTHELVRGFFAFESLGLHELKGVSRPMEAQRALRETGTAGRLGDGRKGDRVPLAGRQRELATLLAAHERACAGTGQVVLLWGEAGIGKSRLQDTLHDHVEASGAAWLYCYCSPDYQHSALKPVYHLLRRVFTIAREDSEEVQIEKVRAGLAEWEPCPDDWYPLFAAQLGLPHSEDNLPPSPQHRKERTLEAIVELLHRVAEWKPLVLSVENIQYVDPSTRELLARIVNSTAGSRLLAIYSFRSTLSPPWPEGRRVTHLPLEPLAESEVHEMIEAVTADKALPPEVTREIVERTDGVPLFVEELTRMLIRSELLELQGDRYVFKGPLPEHAIPNTLQDLLLARLERLVPSLELTRRCSVLGRRFSHALVAAIAGLEPEVLRERLAHLVSERILRQDGSLPNAQYTFRHALMHDAAYESLLKKQRKTLHSQAADVLREEFAGIAASAPEILAQHYERAERFAEAVDCRKTAGRRAAATWAHLEAISHFERALTDLAALPATRERSLAELELLSSLGVAHISIRGYAAPEVQETFRRASALCEELGDTPFPVRYGIWAVTFLRSDRAAAAEQVPRFQRDAESSPDPDERLMAQACIANWAFYTGDLTAAGEALRATRELFDAKTHHRVARNHGGCGGFYGHLLTSWWLALTGQVERALEHQGEVLTLAESLDHPYTLAMTLSYGAVVAHEARAVERCRELSERLAETAAENGFALLSATADMTLGWSLAKGGEGDGAIARIEAGLALYRSTGALTLVPFYSGILAETLLLTGEPERARGVLEEAITLSRENLDSFQEAELLRLLGDALAGMAAPREDVQARYAEAFACAQAGGIALQEMRAALSLARSLRGSSRSDEARHVLRRAIDNFESSASFADLDEARSVLTELS